MRNITLIIIHCSAVRPERESGFKDIDEWHHDRGFTNGCGYHYIVRRDGSIETGRPLEMIGAHCVGHNRHSIGVCYEGGLNAAGKAADTRTAEQKVALRKLLEQLHEQFPKAVIVGHNVFNRTKKCPCFDAVREYSDLNPDNGEGSFLK